MTDISNIILLIDYWENQYDQVNQRLNKSEEDESDMKAMNEMLNTLESILVAKTNEIITNHNAGLN